MEERRADDVTRHRVDELVADMQKLEATVVTRDWMMSEFRTVTVHLANLDRAIGELKKDFQQERAAKRSEESQRRVAAFGAMVAAGLALMVSLTIAVMTLSGNLPTAMS